MEMGFHRGKTSLKSKFDEEADWKGNCIYESEIEGGRCTSCCLDVSQPERRLLVRNNISFDADRSCAPASPEK